MRSIWLVALAVSVTAAARQMIVVVQVHRLMNVSRIAIRLVVGMSVVMLLLLVLLLMMMMSSATWPRRRRRFTAFTGSTAAASRLWGVNSIRRITAAAAAAGLPS